MNNKKAKTVGDALAVFIAFVRNEEIKRLKEEAEQHNQKTT
jgi:hypothetical protein